MDYLFPSQDPSFVEKTSKYCQNPQTVLKSLFDSFRRGHNELMTDQRDLTPIRKKTILEIQENSRKSRVVVESLKS
jgi:hypothetical protein